MAISKTYFCDKLWGASIIKDQSVFCGTQAFSHSGDIVRGSRISTPIPAYKNVSDGMLTL